MTEHTDKLTEERAEEFVHACDTLSDETFCFIPGFEVPYKRAHVLMIGARTFHGAYAPTIEALRVWADAAPFVVLAHPVRNQFEVSDDLLDVVDGLEVWNQQYEGKCVPRIRSLALFEALRTKKPSLVATGGLDFHRIEHFGAPLVRLNVSELRADAILEKLKAGVFVIASDDACVYGSLPNARELVSRYRVQSHVSVIVIMLGKTVNAFLASLGVSLPKCVKQLVRKRI